MGLSSITLTGALSAAIRESVAQESRYLVASGGAPQIPANLLLQPEQKDLFYRPRSTPPPNKPEKLAAACLANSPRTRLA